MSSPSIQPLVFAKADIEEHTALFDAAIVLDTTEASRELDEAHQHISALLHIDQVSAANHAAMKHLAALWFPEVELDLFNTARLLDATRFLPSRELAEAVHAMQQEVSESDHFARTTNADDPLAEERRAAMDRWHEVNVTPVVLLAGPNDSVWTEEPEIGYREAVRVSGFYGYFELYRPMKHRVRARAFS